MSEDLLDFADELWEAIAPLVPARRREAVARAIVELLEANDCEDVEVTRVYAVAYDEDEDFDEVDFEDTEDE